VGSNSRMHLDF